MALPSAISSLMASVLLATGTAAAAETSTAAVVVNVRITARTALHVSSEMLLFGDDRGSVVIDFRAGARVAPDADVVLSVEPLRSIEGPGGAADVDASVDFIGEGNGTIAGTLTNVASAIAGRWHGSGLRQGRLVFTLHASEPGVYTMPVRFVLSTP